METSPGDGGRTDPDRDATTMHDRLADRDWRWRRRTFLKGVGASGVAVGVGAAAMSQTNLGRTAEPAPLEASPSAVSFDHYASLAGQTATGEEGSDATPAAAYGFPTHPLAAGSDPSGQLFDTTVPTVAGDGETITYLLRFGGDPTPYQLVHRGGGTYRAVDATVTFEWSERELFPLPFLTVGETYRAEVREVVQLYAPGGAYDWSTTRTDLVDPSTDQPVVSVLTVVWDVDGPDNGATLPRGSPGRGVADPEGPLAPTFPREVTPTADGLGIRETATWLLGLGPMATSG